MKYVECNSIDVYIDNLNGLDVEATQVGSGRFFSTNRNVKLPLIEINHWRINTSILYHGALAQDKIYLSFPIERESQIIDGKVFGSDSILAVLPDEDLLVLHPKLVETMDFLIPLAVLQDYYKYQNLTDTLPSLKNLRNKTTFSNIENLKIKQLINYTLSVIDQVSQWNYLAAVDAQDTILVNILEILGESGGKKVICSSKHRVVVVKRALAAIHKEPKSNLTIVELSNICFCSIRTLEYSFKSILGCSPKAYLIKRRLNLIKHEIKCSPEKSISRIAIDFGVVNAGRFSNDYFMYFGEYPSDTRNK
ncbi:MULTISPECIES: helix-turn-helix domain-containing protein [Shewanella]|uniref:helix-turn-helix domain-containing protein n=1 Tax=Shewanella TaxID=22 RepID=UPI000C3BAD5B|nr:MULTISPECIES: helix-turn-helix domain-containing protein [Shewanella]NCQ46123.1 AraC family transcriptional regulator [Shewanella frigidimarina]NCO70581.1 AraC family transcriptional regulator [Shewanella vesiculosa]NCP36347.1 AraC family transcriptional regulator [Shewanella vesiculosa]NCP69628.1 AraC family transcriptional regulator [Shewanella vesiculosa]NCP74989.1 AraC family transcriptional regulator [Shewanella vesiculosa]|tara:strand:- start:472 stop:1392 length:921 start_codon:yes stop_codon:yes gene_type:complete